MTRINIRHMLEKRLASGTAYYFNPTKAMKTAGFTAEALGPDVIAAAARAEVLNGQWDALQKNAPTGPLAGTMAWLIREHQRSDEYKGRVSASNEEVDRACKIIGERFGKYQVAAIERRHVKKFYKDQREAGSLHRANTILKWLRYLLFEAIDAGLIQTNPAAKMRVKGTPPRKVIWADAEIAAVEAAAVDQGRASVALAVRLACDLGQRQGDILRLPWSAYDGTRVTIKQSKTGNVVKVKVLPELKAKLDIAMVSKRSPLMVVSEATGRPYQKLQFNRLFRAALEKVPSAAEKQFRDLRRSASVRLAEASCTPQEVANVTGWKIATAMRMLDTYTPPTTALADNAIAKLGRARKRTKSE